jgi:hypothetical protein
LSVELGLLDWIFFFIIWFEVEGHQHVSFELILYLLFFYFFLSCFIKALSKLTTNPSLIALDPSNLNITNMWRKLLFPPPVFFSTPEFPLMPLRKRVGLHVPNFYINFPPRTLKHGARNVLFKSSNRKIRTFSFNFFEFSGVILDFRGVKKS